MHILQQDFYNWFLVPNPSYTETPELSSLEKWKQKVVCFEREQVKMLSNIVERLVEIISSV